MAKSSWIQYWTGWLFKSKAAELALTPEHYLQLTIQCMERVRKMTWRKDSKSVQVKFNHAQCLLLDDTLDQTIDGALLELSASPEDASERLELYKILFMLAKEVEGFIHGCSKENWIQAAIMSTNMSEHVWSLSSDLALWGLVYRPPWWKSPDIPGVISKKLKDVKWRTVIDDVKLSTRVRALIESGEASDDDHELATFLLARMDRLRQPIPPLDTSELLQSSVHERSDIPSLEYVARIGNGGSATVHKAIWRGVEVAVKTFHGPENPDFKREVSICARVSHANIASFLFYGVDNGEGSIVMELMDDDLQSLMRTRLRCNRMWNSPFCMFVALDLMLQIAEGMRYLHEMRIVHRDLKSHNILVRCAKSPEVNGYEYVHAKVADFGLSRTKEKSMTYSNQTPNIGTTRWMAPEMFDQGRHVGEERYPFKSDVYSFGMVCYEILTGKFPFSSIDSNAEIRRKVMAGDRPELPLDCPSKLRTLIEECWSPEAKTRPWFADICLELSYLKCSQYSWRGMGTYAASTSEKPGAEPLAEASGSIEADSICSFYGRMQS